mmetsp:Transcript_14472/g.29745  ORF Transcript_14472/g.29745 Transcript_14472/m.29745 type:complete len:191 (+) Transcript_14472:174-746(+)
MEGATFVLVVGGGVGELDDGGMKRLDELGEKSGVAQNLRGPITNTKLMMEKKAETENHRLYCLDGGSATGGLFGYIKTGVKNLWLYNEGERKKGLQDCPKVTCVLDFYVDESVQRGGWGRKLFDAMVEDLSMSDASQLKSVPTNEIPGRLAYDRPSPKMIPFLAKHFGLTKIVEQSNNYIVFQPFWDARN